MLLKESRMAASRRSVEPETLRLPLGAAVVGRSSRVEVLLAMAAASGAVATLVLPVGLLSRLAIACGLFIAAAALYRLSARPRRARRGVVTVDATGVSRTDESGVARLARWGEPLGVTVFANHDRTRMLLAFTSASEARFLSVRVAGPADAAAAPVLFTRAATVADTDIQGVRRDDDGALSAADAERLVLAAGVKAPGALDRILLSDARGEAVVLEGGKLRLGARTFDLQTPLEWRGFMFHEGAGRVAALYQATWIRQSDTEAVLVAPLPAESSWARDLRASARPNPARDVLAQRSVVRDLYLAQSLPDTPPPRELRHAIDRLFMLPLRQALDRAPRISRISIPPERQPEGRA
jgi:hypothetical protein